MKFGVQLYGMLRGCQESPDEILSRLAAMGIVHIEPCVRPDYDGEPDDPSVWTVSQFTKYMTTVQELGMESRSAHIFFEDIGQAAAQLKVWYAAYGIRQYVCNVQEEPTRAYCEVLAAKLSKLAEIVADDGIEILLHCLEPEVSVQIDGVTAYEWILKQCNGKVYAQPDVGFLLKAGMNVDDFLWRNRERIRSLHYKDHDGMNEVPTGKGRLDIDACFQFARYLEIPQIIDQDSSNGDFYQDIEGALRILSGKTFVRQNTTSRLCVLDVATGESRVLKAYDGVIEAPNWLNDGRTLIYNRDGRLWKYHMDTDMDEMIDTGFCDNCNNDHVLSPDHTMIALSHGGPSKVYIVSVDGGVPECITDNAPSYLHGWSPDGEELAYCAFRDRDGMTAVDVYAIPADGGEEWPLTEGDFNDGPEYSPDGKHVWFNSTRSGLMQIYRMNRDGSGVTQMTFENRNNWFAHVSPDGGRVINISYTAEGLEPSEHLPNMQVELWIMNYDGSERKLLKKLDGGQGTINVNSWAPDSRHIAYVEYMFV